MTTKYRYHFENPMLAILLALTFGKSRGHRVKIDGKCSYYIDRYLFEKCLSLNQSRANGSSYKKTANYLGATPSVLLKLIQLGFINPSYYGKELLIHIPFSQVKRFKAKYILSSELAKKSNMQIKPLHDFLDSQNVDFEVDLKCDSERLYDRVTTLEALPKSQISNEALTLAMMKFVDEEF